MLDFRVSAVSDDKRDFVCVWGVNLTAGALPDAVIAAVMPMLATDAAGAVVPDGAAPRTGCAGRSAGQVTRSAARNAALTCGARP